MHIGSWFNGSPICFAVLAGTSLSSAAWPAANRALYVPIYLPNYFTVARFIILNGANTTGDVDVGLYNNAGSRLISTGSTARSGTNAAQYIGVTDQSFPPGCYYLALVCGSATGQFMRAATSANGIAQYNGYLQEDLGSVSLPSTMTPAVYGSSAMFHWGFTQSDTL